MSRILQTRVTAYFSPDGPIEAFLIGEAPGPKEADKSHIPFWGDWSGLVIYRCLADEIRQASRRCPGVLRLVTLGKCAVTALSHVPEAANLPLFALPHPSAQGLLQATPDRGKGLKLADLAAAWQTQLQQIIAGGDE